MVVFSSNDIALGFGVTARNTLLIKDLELTAVLVFNQSDIGEYLRVEDTGNWFEYFEFWCGIVWVFYYLYFDMGKYDWLN